MAEPQGSGSAGAATTWPPAPGPSSTGRRRSSFETVISP